MEKSSYSNKRGEKNSNMTQNIYLESKNNILEKIKKIHIKILIILLI